MDWLRHQAALARQITRSFGVKAVFTQGDQVTEIMGDYNRAYVEQTVQGGAMMSVTQPAIIIRDETLPHRAQIGDRVEVGGESFEIVDVHRAGYGLTLCLLMDFDDDDEND